MLTVRRKILKCQRAIVCILLLLQSKISGYQTLSQKQFALSTGWASSSRSSSIMTRLLEAGQLQWRGGLPAARAPRNQFDDSDLIHPACDLYGRRRGLRLSDLSLRRSWWPKWSHTNHLASCWAPVTSQYTDTQSRTGPRRSGLEEPRTLHSSQDLTLHGQPRDPS